MSERERSSATPETGFESRADASAAVLEAFDGLRRDIRARFPRDRPEAPGEPTVDVEAMWNGVRRRLGTVGMRDRDDGIDEFGMDTDALQSLRPLFDFLADRYWRIEIAGLDHLRNDGGCLLVANRAGLLPWDGLMLAHVLQRARPDRDRPRFLVADWLIQRPFAHATLAQLGGVRACRENLLRLLADGKQVIAFPEGARGATKAYRDRYRVQRFDSAADIRAAHSAGVPVVPVGIVGAEEVQPLMWKLEAPAQRVGLPFLPVTPTFPMLGPLGLAPLPSKWAIRIGRPIDLDGDADDLVDENERMRGAIEGLVKAALHDRESVWR